MTLFNQLFKYPMKRRKKSLFSAFCLLAVVYAGFQIIYFDDGYSPLQLLSSVEREANRLWHFITQPHIQCNSSIPTNNLSIWLICQDATNELPPDLSASKGLVYSVGPGFDLSFEHVIDRNSSYQQYIFSAFKSKQWESFSNHTLFKQISVVPNDPSDFARNSYQTQTLNSIHESLGHQQVAILKIDNQMETVQSHELLHFLIEDSWVSNVKELHFVIQLDKVDADDIYNWYRVLYSLFHKSGFRLYHTSTSNSLCLQDTIMESCKYYLSWVRDVPPNVFVLHPPAIDGSFEYEEDRMRELLDEMSADTVDMFPVTLKLSVSNVVNARKNSNFNRTSDVQLMHLKMAEKIHENTPSCTVLFILNVDLEGYSGLEKTKCKAMYLSPVFARGTGSYTFELISQSNDKATRRPNVITIENMHSILQKTKVNILVVEIGESWDSWGLLTSLLSQGIPGTVDEMILVTSIFQQHNKQPMLLRRKYSAIKQLQAYNLVGIHWDQQMTEHTLKFGSNQELFNLNFIKSKYIA